MEDGPTHHGVHDVAFLRNMPNISILAPSNEQELHDMLFAAYNQNSPVVIRYPRGGANPIFKRDVPQVQWGKAETIQTGKDIAIWSLGKELETAYNVAYQLSEKYGLSTTIINTRFIVPFDKELLLEQIKTMPIITIEDLQVQGGLGSTVDELLINKPHKGVLHFGWGCDIIPHGNVSDIKAKFGLDATTIAEEIYTYINNRE